MTYELGAGNVKERQLSHGNGMGISHNIGYGNGKECELSHGNGNESQYYVCKWEVMGIDCMAVGRTGNQKTHSRSSLM